MNTNDEVLRLRSAAIGIAALRIWLGVWFLIALYAHAPLHGLRAWPFPADLQAWIKHALEEGGFAFYRPFLSTLVEYPGATAWAVLLLEALTGALLVLGLFTRVATALALFLCLNFWFAAGHLGPSFLAAAMTLGVTAACLFLANAGRFFGIDALRAGKVS